MTLYIFVVFLFDSKKKLSTRAAQSAGGAVSTKTSQRRRHEKKKGKTFPDRFLFLVCLFVCLFRSASLFFFFVVARKQKRKRTKVGRNAVWFFLLSFFACVLYFSRPALQTATETR